MLLQEGAAVSVKARVIKTSESSIRDKFCSGCLATKLTGEKELVQIRMRNGGCRTDFFLCKKCAKEMVKSLEGVLGE